MALEAGSVDSATGLAYAMYVQMQEQFGPFNTTVKTQITPFFDRLAIAVVGYIVSNAEVNVVVTEGGLQTSTPSGTATGAPSAGQDLTGTVSLLLERKDLNTGTCSG